MIPIFFALAAFVLAGIGLTKRSRAKVSAAVVTLSNVGQTATLPDLDLKKGELYHLTIAPKGGIRLNQSATMAATLMDASGAQLFNIEDSYWHQRGVWREGGESGTWEEANQITQFDFWVPEDGKYDIEFELVTSSAMQVSASVVVEKSNPFPLAEFPLLIGGVFLLGIGGFVWMRRERSLVKYVKQLGYGSRIRIDGTEYEVTRIFDYGEDGDSTASVEFELTDSAGIRRHLGVEVLEKWWEDSEDNEHVRRYHRMLVEVPTNETERAEVEADYERSSRSIRLRGTNFIYDEDNSGNGIMTDWRGGKPATTRYRTLLFRTGVFGVSPGSLWAERINYGDGEVEWALMQVVNWKDVDVLSAKPRPNKSPSDESPS